MKKVLLASTALIAFGAVSANAAEPIKLGLGGYATEYVGFAQNGNGVTTGGSGLTTPSAANAPGAAVSKATTVDVQSDININFLGSTKLDNGISVAVEVDTFGSQRSDSRNVNANGGKGNSDVKRDFITVSGAFGALIVGEREDALYIVHNSAPDVGTLGLQDGIWYQWVLDPTKHRTYNATNTSRYDERTQKISYVTPSFYGLAAAASYVPSISLSGSGHTTVPNSSADGFTTLSSGLVNRQDLNGDVYGAGLAYTNTFGGLSVKADGGYAIANAAGLGLVQGGIQVGYAGFVLGGSILNRHVDGSARMGTDATDANGISNALVKTAAYAGQSWDAGLSYTTGPFAVSAGFFHDSSKDDAGFAGTGSIASLGNGGGADSTDAWVLSGAYTMGPGVVWQNSLAHVSYKDGAGSTAFTNRNVGNTLVTGVKVTF